MWRAYRAEEHLSFNVLTPEDEEPLGPPLKSYPWYGKFLSVSIKLQWTLCSAHFDLAHKEHITKMAILIKHLKKGYCCLVFVLFYTIIVTVHLSET